MTSQPKILCIHPNGELYGSDRVFLQSVSAFRERWPDAHITIQIPVEGPLAEELRKSEADVRVAPMNVLRRAKLGRTIANMARLPLDILAMRKAMKAYDLIYISTLVVLDAILATRFSRVPALLHVHELPTGREGQLFEAILKLSSAKPVCISHAVRAAFPGLHGRTMPVIWNGVADRGFQPARTRDGRLRLLLIGRFNAWKGQGLLLEALSNLSADERSRLDVRIVGSVYEGQEHFEQQIRETIALNHLQDCVTVSGFIPVPDEHFNWTDIVVVPSTKPEPFGLVAIEGMAAHRAVIAAGHGGLAEIVENGQGGALFTPGDAASLSQAIRTYLQQPDLVAVHGAAARSRYESEFTDKVYRRKLADEAQASLA